ncbi:MAG: hypothetical protein PHY93_19655 [Bacteriovorax sp.]|nr:hypothetical protein [Bacteriovorax sp.]
MSKTLVVSDNEILNQLYVINLEVYLATEVALVLSTQKAQELIESGENYDLVITMNMINGLDSAVTLYEFLKTKNLTTPLVVIGNPVKEIPDIVVVQSSYHLKNLLRSCADILGITSKSMAALNVPEYYSVDTKFLMRLGEAPCQIFLQVKKSSEGTNYAMVAKKGSSTTEVLRKFLSEGIVNLYVNKLDRLLVINQISKILCDFIKSSEHLGMVEKSAALEAGFEFVASDFCQSPEATQEVMNIANSCTKVMEEISKETPGLRALLQLLNSNKNGYIYTHSILSSFIASHIVKKVSWGGEGHLEKINFVLFFHDIMLAPIYLKHPTLKYEEDLLFNDDLSVKEKELVLNHARMAAELVITYRRSPMGADLLIKQHHGMTNGIGFAIDFKDDISPLSKIVIISEAFVEEYMKGKDSDPDYQIDLKKIIPALIEKFKKSTYKKIIETLETIKL